MESATAEGTVEGRSSQEPDFPDPEPRAKGKPSKGDKAPTNYVVLVGDATQGKITWVELTTVPAQNQAAAKRAAITGSEQLRRILAEQGGVPLVAVPEKSWKPSTASIKTQETLTV